MQRMRTEADVLEALVEGLVNGVEHTVTVTALTSHPDVEGPASEPQTATPAAPVIPSSASACRSNRRRSLSGAWCRPLRC